MKIINDKIYKMVLLSLGYWFIDDNKTINLAIKEHYKGGDAIINSLATEMYHRVTSGLILQVSITIILSSAGLVFLYNQLMLQNYSTSAMVFSLLFLVFMLQLRVVLDRINDASQHFYMILKTFSIYNQLDATFDEANDDKFLRQYLDGLGVTIVKK